MSGIGDMVPGLGALKKLKILSYTNMEQTEGELKFEAYYNPTMVTSTYGLQYDELAPQGTSKLEMKLRTFSPITFTFDLYLDGTGASIPDGIEDDSSGGKNSKLKVEKKIENFINITHTYEGQCHRPRYLLLSWGGSLVANVVLSALVITKDLFEPSGDTLRAKLACTFKEYSEAKQTKANEKASSPDMTHIRIVRQGDRLPLMCERIYGDATLYLQVAKHNNLVNYRKLTPGQQIYFPPLVPNKS
jgi:hypothetical protein